jgi:hypothetical protein
MKPILHWKKSKAEHSLWSASPVKRRAKRKPSIHVYTHKIGS